MKTPTVLALVALAVACGYALGVARRPAQREAPATGWYARMLREVGPMPETCYHCGAAASQTGENDGRYVCGATWARVSSLEDCSLAFGVSRSGTGCYRDPTADQTATVKAYVPGAEAQP